MFTVSYTDRLDKFVTRLTKLMKDKLGLDLNAEKCLIFACDDGVNGKAEVAAFAARQGFKDVNDRRFCCRRDPGRQRRVSKGTRRERLQGRRA